MTTDPALITNDLIKENSHLDLTTLEDMIHGSLGDDVHRAVRQECVNEPRRRAFILARAGRARPCGEAGTAFRRVISTVRRWSKKHRAIRDWCLHVTKGWRWYAIETEA